MLKRGTILQKAIGLLGTQKRLALLLVLFVGLLGAASVMAAVTLVPRHQGEVTLEKPNELTSEKNEVEKVKPQVDQGNPKGAPKEEITPAEKLQDTPAKPPAQPSAPPDKPLTPPSDPAPPVVAPPSGPTLPAPIAETSYKLAFSDEFNGTSVDRTKWDTNMTWSTQTPVCRSSGDTGCYNDNNVTVGGGIARIKADKSGSNYTIGILNTDHKFRFTYGYVEVRARLPKGQGLWPGIWTYNPQYVADEMDILEFLGKDTRTAYQTYHYAGGSKQFAPKLGDWTAGYHTFAMKWEPDLLIFYIDNTETGRFTGSAVSKVPAYLMINLDLGGSWGGPVDGTTPFPSYFDIDYARIYQKS